ncbi:MAG TPA: alpha/beta hydrolase [Pseudomonadales bacterium]|nr:alpha/beta hydrolase [Pseudomonadales bacterium]
MRWNRWAGPCALLVGALGAAGQGLPAQRDLAYVERGTPEQTLDLYLPGGQDFATVIFVHGGSLQRGDDRNSDFYAQVQEPFVAAGIACAKIDYRVAPEHRWPAMPQDVATATRWVRERVATLGGDPSRIFLFGHSSGALLVAVLGNNAKYLQAVGMQPSDLAGIVPMGATMAPLRETLAWAAQSGVDTDSLRVLFAREADEVYATLEDRLDADPSRFVGAHTPPTLIVLAERERFLPPVLEQAALLVRLMYDAERPADLVIVPGTHKSSIADLAAQGDPAFAAIRRFIENPHAAGEGSRPSSIR